MPKTSFAGESSIVLSFRIPMQASSSPLTSFVCVGTLGMGICSGLRRKFNGRSYGPYTIGVREGSQLTSYPPLSGNSCNDLRFLASSRSHKERACRNEASTAGTEISRAISSLVDVAIGPESQNLCAYHSGAGTGATPMRYVRRSGRASGTKYTVE